MQKIRFTPYKVDEEFRTYFFGKGKSITFHDVVEVSIEDCIQRVITKDGMINIIPDGWISIMIKKRVKSK